jgi:hypothetical protein
MRGSLLAAGLWFAATLLPGAPGIAQTADEDIVSHIISLPVPSAYRVDGLRDKAPVRSDSKVQGGKALRVDVPRKGAHEWDVAVSVPINKPVKAGDPLVLAFWARLEHGENGAASAVLPYNAIQLAHDPYTALFSGPATIGPDWNMYKVEGNADRDHPAGDLNVSIHLATAKQVVDIGPVFVLDMAPGPH